MLLLPLSTLEGELFLGESIKQSACGLRSPQPFLGEQSNQQSIIKNLRSLMNTTDKYIMCE